VIPRYQTVLLVFLVLASAIMGVILWQLHDRDRQRLAKVENALPTKAPEAAAEQQATLYVADDEDDSMSPEAFSLPLPQDPNQRARAVLGKLLDLYAAPGSRHPAPGGAASVAQVFLLPAPGGGQAAAEAGAARSAESSGHPGPELAVVNLTSSFASSHPSGLEAETLTILSICATLHANLPRITEVRFLVDGQPRATLAGHADLMQTYLAAQAAPTAGAHP
jgi:Sporulation and spore germination